METRSVPLTFAAYRVLDDGELIHLGTYPSRKQAEEKIALFRDAFPGKYKVREMADIDFRITR